MFNASRWVKSVLKEKKVSWNRIISYQAKIILYRDVIILFVGKKGDQGVQGPVGPEGLKGDQVSNDLLQNSFFIVYI